MMKILSSKVILPLLFLFILTNAFSQSQNYSNWEIIAGDLSGGRVVMSANETRSITYEITVVRLLNPSGGAGEWLPVNFQFQLQRLPSGSQSCGCTPISSINTITSADFASGENSVTKEYTVPVSALSGSSLTGASLRSNDKIILTVGGSWSPNKSYSVTVNSPPSAPTNLAMSNGSPCSVSLSWSKPPGTVDGYTIYANDVVTQYVTSTTTTIQNLNTNTAYSFKVSAYNGAGDSPKSSAVSYTTAAVQGRNMTFPFEVECGTYTTDVYNHPSQCYGNHYGNISDDIFFRFSVTSTRTVAINTCNGEAVNTTVYLLDNAGNLIESMTTTPELIDSGCEYGSYLEKQVNAGTYYVVVEGVPWDPFGWMNVQIVTREPCTNGFGSEEAVSAKVENSSLQIYPNPTFDHFKVTLAAGETVDVLVKNNQGEVVKEYRSVHTDSLLDISDLSNGLYITYIIAGGKVSTRHLAINK